jgi:hypothetical protein
MRLVLIALLATGCSAFAQRGGSGGGHGAGFRSGGAGRGPVRQGVPPRVAHNHSGTTIVPYPVFYGGYYYDPSLYGNGYATGYADPQAAGPDGGYNSGYAAGYGGDPGAGQSPVVIINQGFRPDTANPVMHDYSNTPLPPGPSAQGQPMQPDDQPTIYLIAMKDHTIFPAVAYWVDGDTLNYITAEGSQNRASMSLVDRDFSTQLNNERHVEFRLPAPK